MNREQFEHVIRASGDVLKEDEVLTVESQTILGSSPTGLPRDVTLSTEADVMAVNDPNGEKALLINGTIGEFTAFDTTYGYYAESHLLGRVLAPRSYLELRNAESEGA